MKKVLLPIAFLVFLALRVNAQNIETIAGTGAPGYAGDNGPAILAKFDHPDVAKFDKAGNMYIADEHNHVIRKINTSGIITTIAGTGYGAGTLSGGYTGDNGPATNAELSRPLDLAFDASGNMYIAELGNSAIRRISTSGIISTIAGIGSPGDSGDNGPATIAQLYDPLGLVFDGLGNLYFSDNGNQRIRKINTEGIITTVAGNGTIGFSGDGFPATNAQIRYGGYLAFGPSGELFIADYGNYRIRKINTTGIISTVLGDGTNVNSGDGNPAIAATIGSMFTILFDPAGNMYISDRVNSVIRKVNTSGIISTIAGIGTEGYGGDNGPATAAEFNVDVYCSAVDDAGNLYIADPNNNRIRRITYNNTAVNNVYNNTQAITLYPNPAHTEITIKTNEKIESVEVINIIGASIPGTASAKTLSQTEQSLDVSFLPNGIYFVKVNGVYAGRFVKE